MAFKEKSPLWRTDKNKIGPDGKPVRFMIPGADMNALPELVFPPQRHQMDDDGGGGEWESYKIMLIYEDDSVEMIPITAIDGDDALNKALENRDPARKHLKIKTSIVQDGVGEVLAQLAHGLQRGYTVGKKGIGKIGRAGASVIGDIGHAGGEIAGGIGIGAGRTVATFRRTGRQYVTGRLERLFEEANSENPAQRAIARREFQMTYPQIYNSIAWTRV